jgi:predicted GNAT family N-acyltransferase
MRDIHAIQIRPATADEMIELRHAVLRPGLPREASIYDVDALPTTRHLAAINGDARIVGCATIFPEPFQARADAWRLRGMAVSPELRGAGVGRKILAVIDDMMRAGTPVPPLLWCNARVTAIGFYQRCGWTVVSGEFNVPGIGPHVNMTRQV